MPHPFSSTHLDKRRKLNHVGVLFHSSRPCQILPDHISTENMIALGGNLGRNVTVEIVLSCSVQVTRGDTPAISWLEGPVSSVFVPTTWSEMASLSVLRDLELVYVSRRCKKPRNGRWRVLEYSSVECIINKRLRK